MANIKDVAEQAGVSVTTVSHVINGTRFVSHPVVQRVNAAVQSLGYVPSAVARSLKHKVTRTLGMMIPNNSNPYFAEIIRGVEGRCFEAGYNLILCNSNDDVQRQAAYVRVLTEKRIDGLILVCSGSEAAVMSALQDIRIPLVLLDREIPGMPESDLVEVNHTRGAALATHHLLDLGHTRIACISGPAGLPPSTQRRAGWKQALSEKNVPRWEGDLARGDFSARGGYQAMQTLLKRRPNFSAVFVCNDLMALGALAAAREAGISVPYQLSVVGFDDIELAVFSSPPLTTVAQPKQKMGRMAADLLLERLEQGREQVHRVILDPELMVRASTLPPPHQR